MAWFYNLLIDAGVEATAASWGTAAVAVLLVYAVIAVIKNLCK